MARLKQGYMGPFIGKLGTAVGYILNGEGIIRSLPRVNEHREFSEKELANQQAFTVLQYWLRPLKLFLRVGFKNYAPKFEGFSAAKSYNSSRAIAGAYPDYFIDPSAAFVSYGHLEPSTEAAAVVQEPGKILLTWSGGDYINGEKMMFVLYDTEAGEALTDTGAAFRAKGRYEVDLEGRYSGRKFQVYIAFVTSDQSNQSTSQYLGEVTVL
ncbi:DUF6266 family protein [Pedobacter faecalis]|uniref:DUF6266 family protein n=1 Tax=Pedobacter faecalis TaxID=3041495 RepID=UPI00254B3618|nr:DUF6266 family protein [Pedobacter sp. ELA7]